MFSIDSLIGHASDSPFTVRHMNPFIFAMVFVHAEVLCNHTLAHLAPVQPPYTAHRDKRSPGVMVSGVWPPFPIDEWHLTMDPRKVEEFRKKWEKDMKAALRELDGSVVSPDQGTKSQPRVQSEKAAPHPPSPSEFPLDLATLQQRVRLDKAAPHLPSPTEFPLELAMKLEAKL